MREMGWGERRENERKRRRIHTHTEGTQGQNGRGKENRDSETEPNGPKWQEAQFSHASGPFYLADHTLAHRLAQSAAWLCSLDPLPLSLSPISPALNLVFCLPCPFLLSLRQLDFTVYVCLLYISFLPPKLARNQAQNNVGHTAHKPERRQERHRPQHKRQVGL